MSQNKKIKPQMTVCYFGIYNPDYSRNRVLIKGLRENNVEIIECNNRAFGFRKYLNLARKHCRLKKDYDILLVAFPGWTVMWLAKLLTRKPIIYDAFLSVYEGQVEDRRKYSPNSLKAKYYWFLDWLSCKLADKVLLDTNEHIKYFVKTFKIKKDKFIKVLVGTDESVFYPRKRTEPKKEFVVHFHGYFIPLQGVQYIVKAAKILGKYPEIKFQIIGKGQTYNNVVRLAHSLKVKNINFINRLPQKELPKYIQKADVCLGIFGDTKKTQRVIPNKVYEAIAMRKPVITADAPAIRELFTDKKNILLCKTANPRDLAKKILELENNKELRNNIAQGGYEIFKKYATPELIGKNLLKVLKKLKEKKYE